MKFNYLTDAIAYYFDEFIYYYFGRLPFFIILWAILGFLVMCAIVVFMADNRGRNRYLWLAIGIVITPFSAIICLFCMGDTGKRRMDKVLQEERWRREFFKEKTEEE